MKYLWILSFLILGIAYSQTDTLICGFDSSFVESYPQDYQINSFQIGGQLAPATTPNGASVRIVVIFAQFSGDNNDVNDNDWPKDQMPTWADNSFIATNPNQAPFTPGSLSHYYYYMSNGQNKITSYIYPQLVIINGSVSSNVGNSNFSVLQQVDQNINWAQFDKWYMMETYHQYFDSTDGYVDAVYIIWRNINASWDGVGSLLLNDPNNPFTTHDGKKIIDRVPTIGMTLNMGKSHNYRLQGKTLWVLAHEYGHYLWGSSHDFEERACDGYAKRGMGLMNAAYMGRLGINPQEKYLLGYTTYTDLFYDQQGTLGDYLTTGNSYRIPIPLYINGIPNINPSEFFVIANYESVSLGSIYNSATADGIYIYHVTSSDYRMNCMSMVDADGLYQWEVTGWQAVTGLGGSSDWHCVYGENVQPSYLPKIRKVSVDKINGRNVIQPVVSARYLNPSGQNVWWDRWFDENGIQQYAFGGPPDAYNIGYNQIFSPWSNPPSKDKNNTTTNIAVELLSKSGSTFNLKFYTSSASSLAAPPAKPSLLQVSVGSLHHPLLTWSANSEPNLNCYKLYKSTNSGQSWQFLAQTASNSYEDISELFCTTNVLYKVTAINTSSLESVASDQIAAVLDPMTSDLYINNGQTLVISGTCNLQKDIYVLVGGSLNIIPGSILNMTDNSLFIEGTLTAIGGTTGLSDRITFQPGGTSGYWGLITFSGTQSSGSVLQNIHFNYSTGIQCLDGADVTITGCIFISPAQEIYVYDSSPQITHNNINEPLLSGIICNLAGSFFKDIIINGNTITKSSNNNSYHGYQGIWSYDSKSQVSQNIVNGFYFGAIMNGGSNSMFTYCQYLNPYPNNLFTDNFYGITAGGGSSVLAGDLMSEIGSYNSCHDNIYYDVWCHEYSSVYAGDNWWGGVEPNYLVDGTSWFTYYNEFLWSDPWEEQNLAKGNPSNKAESLNHADKSMSSDSSSNNNLGFGLFLENQGRVDDAIKFYKGLISNDQYVRIALLKLLSIEYKYTKNEIADYLASLMSNNRKYYPLIKKLLGDVYLKRNQFDDAVIAYDNAIKTDPSGYDGISARFEKLFAYLHIKKDSTTASQILSEIKGLNSEDTEVQMRITLAERLMHGKNKSFQKLSYLSNGNIPKSYNLFQNYPNPFNPITTIRYQIPKPGLVTLKVYDILGKETATLVNENKIEGSYDFTFDASRFTSGVYIYQLKVNDYVSSKKMILLK
jgi:tetratricopeptide (TPR) repeat protein